MKLRQTRGSSYFQILVNLGVITANIKLFVPDAGLAMYVGFGVGWIIVTTVLGYLDEFYGIWKAELAYGSGAVNPFFQNMSDKLDKIDEKLTRAENLVEIQNNEFNDK